MADVIRNAASPVVLASGSASALSGLPVTTTVSLSLSGLTVTSNVSGQAVNVSGNVVYTASGFNNVREVGSSIINSTLSGASLITGNSGGNILFSGGPLLSAILRSASGNGIMYVGGPATVSNGVGMPLYANESVTLKVANFNAIGAFASTSGQSLSYIGLL